MFVEEQTDLIGQIAEIAAGATPRQPEPAGPCAWVFSFFAGMGMLDLGLHAAGIESAMVNEQYEPFLRANLQARKCLGLPPPPHGHLHANAADVLTSDTGRAFTAQVEEARRERLTGFAGGPPCPDFANGGLNRGSEGHNGRLSSIYFETVCRYRPDFFLFENVKGLVRTAKHRAFYERMKAMAAEAGYLMADQVLNALHYGVPQFRERVILFGVHRDIVEHRGLPSPAEAFPWDIGRRGDAGMLLDLPWPTTQPFKAGSKRPFPGGVPRDLTVQHWFDENGVDDHPNASMIFNVKRGIARMKSTPEGDESGKRFKRIHRWRFAPTVCFGNNEVFLHPYRLRRLSVAEALALQSVPGRVHLPAMTLGDAFKTVGNGVPYLLARAVGMMVRGYFGV